MAQAHRVFLPVVGSSQPPRLRLGVGIAHYQAHEWRDATLDLLEPSCWKDWLWDHVGTPGYVPAVFSMKVDGWSAAAMHTARDGFPGVMWELGNEPEQGSSRVEPEEAAAFSVLWQQTAGENFAAPGHIIWGKGLSWLQRYLEAGGVVGKFWNVHLYFATNADHWTELWETWKEWMKQNKMIRPVLISETNAHGGCSHIEVMTRIAETLRSDPLLHMALWYSDYDWHNVFHESDLRTADGRRTALGEHFMELTRA